MRSLLGVEPFCVHDDAQFSCTFTPYCWMKGGVAMSGCDSMLYSCCVSHTIARRQVNIFGAKIQIFNIASEASYIYILSRLKLFKKPKKWSILARFWNPKACGQTVLPDRSVLLGQKLAKHAKIGKIQMQYFELFSNILHRTFMSFGNHFCSTFLFSIIRHGRWTFRNSGFTAVLQCCSKLQRDHFRENLKQQKMIIDPKIGIFTLYKKKLSVKIKYEKKIL